VKSSEPSQEGVKSPEPSPDEQARESTTIAIRWLGYGMIVGLIVPILFATNTDDWWEWVETSSLAIVIAAAFACSGGLLGFLFGVPRALGRDSETVVTEAPATSGSSTPATSLSATDTAPAQRAVSIEHQPRGDLRLADEDPGGSRADADRDLSPAPARAG
jgi:hypothetical protein